MTARFNMQGNHRDSPSACIQMEGEGERGGEARGEQRIREEEEEEIFLCCKNACRAKHQALKHNNSMFNHSLMKTSTRRRREAETRLKQRNRDPEKVPQTRENKLEE